MVVATQSLDELCINSIRFLAIDAVEKAMDRDNFMSAEEAQKFGLLDHAYTSRDEVEA